MPWEIVIDEEEKINISNMLLYVMLQYCIIVLDIASWDWYSNVGYWISKRDTKFRNLVSLMDTNKKFKFLPLHNKDVFQSLNLRTVQHISNSLTSTPGSDITATGSNNHEQTSQLVQLIKIVKFQHVKILKKFNQILAKNHRARGSIIQTWEMKIAR